MREMKIWMGIVAVCAYVIAIPMTVSGTALAQTVLRHVPKIPVPDRSQIGGATEKMNIPPTPGQPPPPDPSTYGLDPKTGLFKYPSATPAMPLFTLNTFKGSLPYLDQNQYAKNFKLVAHYPIVTSPGHTWPAHLDWNGKRYLIEYARENYKVFDITDPREMKVLYEAGVMKKETIEALLGAMTIKYSKALDKTLAISCHQSQRFGVVNDKWSEPETVSRLRAYRSFRGFYIYEVTGPDPKEWKLLSRTPLDPYHPDPETMPQQGSGCIDVPTYFGGKYLFVAGASDDTFANQEYRSTLYTGGHVAYDISDPVHPRRLGSWWVPGTRLGEEAEYRKFPNAGNHESWMGARQSMFIPTPVEDGGKYGYTVMGGFGFYVLDISNPSDIKTVAHVPLPVSIAGNEGDNVDPTKINTSGIAYVNGYPLNDDCYEPEKPVFAIDVKDPAEAHIIGTLPRPVPPKEAPFTDYCQRRGTFGPKRPGYPELQPGTPDPRFVIYSYYNAGMQMFDVSDPQNPKIAGYFVPRMVDPKMPISLQYNDTTRGIYIEWDRKLVWLFTNTGIYVVSSPLLGEPNLGAPAGATN